MPIVCKNVELRGYYVHNIKENKIMFNEQYLPKLNEKLVAGEHVRVKLFDGYSRSKELSKPNNELFGLLEFLFNKRLRHSRRSIKEATWDANIVSRRNILTRIAVSPYTHTSEYDPGFMIAARQLKGVVFLHEIYDVRPTPKTPQENKKEKRTLANRRKRAYIRAKLDQHLTIITDKENTKPYIPTSPDPVFNWTAVNTFEMTDETTGKTHRLLTGSTCSAVDESGKCVQIMPFRSKSSPKTPKELASWHTFANLQPRWYMHALFSDQYRVIGGVYHQTTNELMQLVDMNASEWLENREGWELDVCLVYLFDILTQIRVALSKMPDDTMFIVQRAKQSSEFKITPLQTNEQAEFEFMNKKFKDLAFPQSSTPAKWR